MPYSQFMAGQPWQEYHVIDARRVPAEMLAKAKGDAAYVIRCEQARTGDQPAEIGMELIGRQTDSQTKSLDREVVRWLEKRIAKVEPDWQPAGERGQSAMVLSEGWEEAVARLNDPEQISGLTIAVLTTHSRDEYGQLLLEKGKS